jgi:LuxR family maltose regulon positive regulatory protein
MQAARTGDLAATEKYVEEARRLPSSDNAPMLGLAWLAQADLQRERGDFAQAISSYEQALPLVPHTGVLSGTWIAAMSLGQAYLTQGQTHQAETLYRSSLAQAVERGQERMPALGILQIELAGIEYERNRLAEARSLFEQGEANSKRSGMADLLAGTARLGARLQRLDGERLDGELPGAVQRLQEVQQFVRRADAPNLSAEISAWLARWQAEAGNLEAAEAWARDVRPCPDHNPGYTHGVELFNLLRVLTLAGRLDDALNLAIRLEALAMKGLSQARTIEACMMQAEVLWCLGRHTDSMGRLARSLELAEPAGYARLFLDEGSRLAPVMLALRSSGQHTVGRSRYYDWLLQSFRQVARPAQPAEPAQPPSVATSMPPASPAGPALTARELDVLRALVQGLTYPEIAALLVVSPGTVKTHVSHIYSKLGVQGRVEAIRRAQELKIV